MSVAVRVEKLTKDFGKVRALDGVSFEVREGEIFGLLGPNGAGKSTLLRILATLLKPTSGTATIMGHDVVKEPEKCRELVGYLPENPQLYGAMKVEEFLRFVCGIWEVPDGEERIREYLKAYSLEDAKDKYIISLSRGMKQKLALIATFIHDPKVLLLDEPAVWLDPGSQEVLRQMIVERAEGGSAVIVCTHLVHLAEGLCNRIGVLKEGKLVGLGRKEELLESTRSASLLEAFSKLMAGERGN